MHSVDRKKKSASFFYSIKFNSIRTNAPWNGMKVKHYNLNNEDISKLYHGAKQKLLIIIISQAWNQFKFAYLSKGRLRLLL